jgi:hypothetical protein
MASQTFSLLSQPGVPSHKGENSARDSTIDLIWSNYAAAIQGMFQGVHVDWSGSLGSDHALICTFASTLLRLSCHREDRTNRFDMSISAEELEEWEHIFAASVPSAITPAPSLIDEIDALVDRIYKVFNSACTATMKKKGSAPGFSAKWWNDECRDAAAALANTESNDDRKACTLKLKLTVRYAKHYWANKYINESNIWEVAAWRHGRRSLHIPALVDYTGSLTHDQQGMDSLYWTDSLQKTEATFRHPSWMIPHPAPLDHSLRSLRRNHSISSNRRLISQHQAYLESDGTFLNADGLSLTTS